MVEPRFVRSGRVAARSIGPAGPARSTEHAGAAAPVHVASADPERIRQVVTDLVRTAVKITEPGGQLRVAAEQRGDQIAVAVSDDGIGIAPELLPRLFIPSGAPPDFDAGGEGISRWRR